MDFNDIQLKHSDWEKAEKMLVESNNDVAFFKRMVDIFIVAASIGISEDKIIENENFDGKSIGRNTLNQNQDVKHLITFLYQNAILSTSLINLSNDERKSIAFNPSDDIAQKYNPSSFLVPYANYGLKKLLECITNHDVESISNVINMINAYKDNPLDLELEETDLDI